MDQANAFPLMLFLVTNYFLMDLFQCINLCISVAPTYFILIMVEKSIKTCELFPKDMMCF